MWLPSPYVIVANAYIRKISKLRINMLRILFKKLGRNKSKMAPEKCKKKKMNRVQIKLKKIRDREKKSTS